MILHRAADPNALLDALADVLEAPSPGRDAVEPEWLIVQTRAMERWLSQRLAARLGVLANARFPYPAQAIDDLLVRLGLAQAERLRFGPRRLTWAIAARLVPPVDPALATLAAYLSADPHGRGRLPLARSIAEVFDDYVAHRPDVVLAWQRGDDGYAARADIPWRDDDAWQPALWRMLVRDLGDAHLATLAARLDERLADARPLPAGVPARLCVVLPTALPPLHVRILRALATRLEVHAFVATPSPARWATVAGWLDHHGDGADGDGRRDSVRAVDGGARRDDDGPPAAEHPLVAANHGVADDLERLLLGRPPGSGAGRAPRPDAGEPGRSGAAAPRALHRPVAADGEPRRDAQRSLLEALQEDIRGDRRPDTASPRFEARDASIELHACHGPQREVEVLRDRLLAALRDDPALRPDDVLVMAPDIAAYAPYVAAVFGVPPGRPGHVPFRVADRGARAESAVFGALEAVLDVLEGRFAASAVLDVLALAPVSERFGLGPDAPDALRRWIDAAAIRWAADGNHRTAFGLPDDPANTWREGLDRLLLGWAMPDDAPPWAGALPRGAFGAADAELLGRVAEAVGVLDGLRAAVDGPRTMAGWADALAAVLAATVAETWRTAEEHATVRAALDDLRRYAEDGGYPGTLPLGVARGLLAARLGDDDPAHGIRTGAMTFCALLPLRGIPHRIVALLGMSDGAFPRAARTPGFDLVARRPRVGDRIQRRADRQLFLEALMAARERLIVSWVGRGMADDAERPPSVVVAELLETLDGMLASDGAADAGGARRRMVVEHPRQPFSPRAFDGADGRPVGFAAEFVPPARVAATIQRFVTRPLAPRADDGAEPGADPAPGAERSAAGASEGVLELDALIGFLRNPCRAFVRGRLGLYLETEDEATRDREPLVLDGLEAWALGTRLLDGGTGALERDAAVARERTAGLLPPGTLGEVAFDEVAARAARVHAARAGHGAAPPDDAGRRVDVRAGEWRVEGVIDGAGPGGLTLAQFGRIKPEHELALWVRHLALCAAADDDGGPPQRSVLVGRDGAMAAFGHVAEAARRLEELVGWWRGGQALPLPLIAQASRAYAATIAGGKGERAARRAAEDAWLPARRTGWTQPGDGDDPYVRQVYRGVNPFALGALPEELPALAAPFEVVAMAIWTPILEARSAGDAAGSEG